MKILELFYYTGCLLKRKYKTANPRKLPVRVISIGNITTGGTGKTPAAMALAERARDMGLKPCILTRGYKGLEKGVCFVSRGEEPLLDVRQAGDEAFLMAKNLKGIPIVKGADRYKAGMFALENLSPDRKPGLFILDDGFQHWGLFRDKDVLLIDSLNPFGNRRLLPLGRLREPLSCLKRADVIILTKTASEKTGGGCQPAEKTTGEIRKYNSFAPVFCAEHMASHFRNTKGVEYPPEWASGRTFWGFCGIGNPDSFRHSLLSVGVELKGLKTFRDHYSYTRKDLERIAGEARDSNSEWIVTTEKDIMKLGTFDLPGNLVSLQIKFHIDDEFYKEVLGRRIWSST